MDLEWEITADILSPLAIDEAGMVVLAATRFVEDAFASGMNIETWKVTPEEIGGRFPELEDWQREALFKVLSDTDIVMRIGKADYDGESLSGEYGALSFVGPIIAAQLAKDNAEPISFPCLSEAIPKDFLVIIGQKGVREIDPHELAGNPLSVIAKNIAEVAGVALAKKALKKTLDGLAPTARPKPGF